MKTVIIASLNPVKINATRGAFAAMFPDEDFTFTGCDVPSEVPEQPMGTEESLRGVHTRLDNAQKACPAAHFFVAFEGGLIDDGQDLLNLFYVGICDRNGRRSIIEGVKHPLPARIAELVRGGMSLGDADDLVFQQKNSKQAGGITGLLTDGALTRIDTHTQLALYALIRFKNPDLYPIEKQKAA
jgi:inosine/xanthosine triphosphatase